MLGLHKYFPSSIENEFKYQIDFPLVLILGDKGTRFAFYITHLVYTSIMSNSYLSPLKML